MIVLALGAGSCRGGRARTLGIPHSSPGLLTGRRRARSTRGVGRGRKRAERGRTRGSYTSGVDQAGAPARPAQVARPAWRWSSPRLSAEAAALIRPTRGVDVVARLIATRVKIDRTEHTLGRLRCAGAVCTRRELTNPAGLLWCGGHSRPPLCPSTEDAARKARRACSSQSAPDNVPQSDLQTRVYRRVTLFERSSVSVAGPAATIPSPSPKAANAAQASRGGEPGLLVATAGPVPFSRLRGLRWRPRTSVRPVVILSARRR